MQIVTTIFIILLVINTILAIFTVFKEKREISATWAWLLVLHLLPGIGFIIYLFLGRKISKDQIYDLKTQKKIGIADVVQEQKDYIKNHNLKLPDKLARRSTQQLMQVLLNKGDAPITVNNSVTVYNDGREKFEALLEDIDRAEDHVHVMYYIFRDDKIGTQIIQALEKKAAQGVEVRLMFDSLGSRGTKNKSFERLIDLGGQVMRSFEKKFRILNTNINFRNHRKIVVIDSKVGYTGGFNVGDDYLGEYEHMGYWRDTHLRIEGDALLDLQARFIADWNASAQDDEDKMTGFGKYFIRYENDGSTPIQIVSSGPDSENQVNKKGFMKMISKAKESVIIQTPYLIPDEAFMETIKIAIASGVNVKIMIPNKPDHPFIYQATLYYSRELAKSGAEIYIYDHGFIHSKFMVIDHKLSTVGTSNFDIRSFKLNFEINAYIYDELVAEQLHRDFERDMSLSYLLDEEVEAGFSRWQLFKQSFSRLLSPLL